MCLRWGASSRRLAPGVPPSGWTAGCSCVSGPPWEWSISDCTRLLLIRRSSGSSERSARSQTIQNKKNKNKQKQNYLKLHIQPLRAFRQADYQHVYPKKSSRFLYHRGLPERGRECNFTCFLEVGQPRSSKTAKHIEFRSNHNIWKMKTAVVGKT